MNTEQARALNEYVDSYTQNLNKIRAFVNDKQVPFEAKIDILRALDTALDTVNNEYGYRI